jgi:hypothetical protein
MNQDEQRMNEQQFFSNETKDTLKLSSFSTKNWK